MNQLIKIIYSLNELDSSISFDPNNKISVFKNLINLTQKINLDEYQLYYGNKFISWDEEKSVKDIVGKELVPIFRIRKKGSPVKNRVIKVKENEKFEIKKSTKDVEVFKTKLLIFSHRKKKNKQINRKMISCSIELL